jgi:exosortase
MSVALQQKLYKPLGIAAALTFVYFAVLMKLGRDWWHDENYSHGLLVPFIIGFIIWQERKRFAEQQSKAAFWIGAACVGLALMALWAGTAGAELFMQRASLLLMLTGILIYFFGARIIQVVAVPILLLALAIPIPQIIFNKIAFPLQLFASKCAVAAMSFFEIPVLRQGNIIELMPLGAKEPKRLAVVEACSGIRSLMTLVTLAVVYAAKGRRRRSTCWRPAACVPDVCVVALRNPGRRLSANRNPDERGARQRHWGAGALLRDESRRRLLSLILRLGDLSGRSRASVCDRLGAGSRCASFQ